MTNRRSIEILSKRSWSEFETVLRKVGLSGDRNIFPYRHARISSRTVDVASVYPVSLYAVRTYIDTQRWLHELFWKAYRIDTLDLDGEFPDLRFSVAGEDGEWMMAPPIVEVSAADGGKPLLIDGEHRCLLARALNRPLRMVWIEGVAPQYPVIALPVTWDQVTVHDRVPASAQKRRFRFQTLEGFPDISSFSTAKLDEHNFRYFFYRDLSTVCTSGIRAVGSL